MVETLRFIRDLVVMVVCVIVVLPATVVLSALIAVGIPLIIMALLTISVIDFVVSYKFGGKNE